MLPMLPPASSAAHAASKALAGDWGKPPLIPLPPPMPPRSNPGGNPPPLPPLKFELRFEFEPLADGRSALPLLAGAAKELVGAMPLGVVAVLLGTLPLPACPACPAWA